MELKHTPKGLALYHEELSIQVDFLSPTFAYRLVHAGSKNELIAKAVGIKPNYRPTIVDATAGLGKDAFMLASLGCTVTMLERSSVLVRLLRDGLERALSNDRVESIAQRMKLIETDSLVYLKNLAAEYYPDVIYLDPMFPERKKAALVKKEMQMLQSLVGTNDDANLLLNCSLMCAKKRVVVKRPRLAPTLTEQKPTFSMTGKTSRFDVYLC
jgi:16S rRNA (guanine1516-N2)-methyltransferase